VFEEKRKYPRIATNVHVRFRNEFLSKEARDYLGGVAENLSLGGMFVSSDHLLSKGSIITLEFEIESEDKNVSTINARAVVRWVRRWRSPRGMGIEFIEFQGVDNHTFAKWIEGLFKNTQTERN